ncbi:Protein of unknown function [Gryllus bimaculatus]|nr:Protein of unknown function [Gryllus bimaculatus]
MKRNLISWPGTTVISGKPAYLHKNLKYFPNPENLIRKDLRRNVAKERTSYAIMFLFKKRLGPKGIAKNLL